MPRCRWLRQFRAWRWVAGCEFLMHAAKRVDRTGSYASVLSRRGVGLIPAGGGCKGFAIRAAGSSQDRRQRRLKIDPAGLHDHRHDQCFEEWCANEGTGLCRRVR